MSAKRNWLIDSAPVFLLACILVAPLFRLEYLNNWASIESSWISDARMLQSHLPHQGWQPLWYCGNRYDYIYPLGLRYAPALISKFAGVSTARAYHLYVALLYAFGIMAVYWWVRVGSGSRIGALIAAAAVMLLSPCFLLFKLIRYDSVWLEPQRLHVLMTYGEGPHIAALSILGAALAATFAAMRRSSPALLAAAAFLSAFSVTHNFYGATSLAIFFTLAVWAAWLANPGWSVIGRAVAIAALAYGLCAFWLTPSYLRITMQDLHWVSEPTSIPWQIAAAAAMLAFFVLSYRFAKGSPGAMWAVFITGSATLLGFYVLPFFYFGAAVLANPARLLPEFDLSCIFVFAAVVSRIFRIPKLRPVAVALLFVAFLPAARYLSHPWGPFPKAGPLDQQYEYRIAKWVHDNLPGERVFATGTVRYWFDGWFDNAQTDGLSLQGMQNQVLPLAMWQVTAGDRGDIALLWLLALGTDAVIVPDKTSPEHFHDFQHPEKFRRFQPLYDDHLGTVVYRVPRTFPAIGRLIAVDGLSGIGPIRAGNDLERLSRYVAVVESRFRGPIEVAWRGSDMFDVSAVVSPGEAILIQETYDPAWHVYANGQPLRVRQDPVMGFMIIDAPPGVQKLQARFQTTFENRIGVITSSASCLVILAFFGVHLTLRRGRASAIQKCAAQLPLHLRFIRMLLRRLNYHLTSIRRDSAREPFDESRLKQCEEALRKMPMPDAAATAYLAKHVPRLARTLALIPPPQEVSRALELGCYMQMTPLLKRVCGYREVRGAYYGPLGRTDRKTMHFPDEDFSCYVDHFDAERERFPYQDEHFDLVIAAEIIEHLTYDPMHMLLEARRVLVDGGHLLLTTPNIGSITSVAKTLDGHDNPQIFFLYERPANGVQTDIGHVREYTVYELGNAVKAAGFEVVHLFTTFIDEFSSHRPLLRFLEENGYSPENRGEQSWCLAIKRASLPVDRYPFFIYNP